VYTCLLCEEVADNPAPQLLGTMFRIHRHLWRGRTNFPSRPGKAPADAVAEVPTWFLGSPSAVLYAKWPNTSSAVKEPFVERHVHLAYTGRMSAHPETLGQRVQRLRAAAGITQAQLAHAAGVPVSSLQNWEIDRREPSFRAACRLAKALGVTAEYLAETVPVERRERASRPAGPTTKQAPLNPGGQRRGR
jgi:DNA-binding XRE family transcriptional regulator